MPKMPKNFPMPPKLTGSDIDHISKDPRVGLLKLRIDDKWVAVYLMEGAARLLQKDLDSFLSDEDKPSRS